MFNTFIYQPLYNLLVSIINIIPGLDFGLYIVLFTIAVRLIILPVSLKMSKNQKAMNEMAPEVKEVNAKYKDDPQTRALKTMELYREYKVNPFVSIFGLVIQMFIIFGLYYIIYRGGFPVIDPERLYSFVSLPAQIPSTIMFSVIDITARNLPLALLAGLTIFWQLKITILPKPPADDDNPMAAMVASMGTQMRFMLPIIIAGVAYFLSAAIAIYFITSNLFQIIQELYVRREYKSATVVK